MSVTPRPLRTPALASGAFVLLAAGSLLAGCGTARRGAPLQADFTPATDEQARGEVVYMRFCNGCHPGGEGGLGPGLNNKPAPGWAIRFQVRHGLGTMPAFREDVIPDADLHALVAYMKALRRHDGGEPTAARGG